MRRLLDLLASAEALGFAAGQRVEREPYEAVYRQIDPNTGAKLGRAPGGYAKFADHLALPFSAVEPILKALTGSNFLDALGLAAEQGAADFLYYPAMPGNSTARPAEKWALQARRQCVQRCAQRALSTALSAAAVSALILRTISRGVLDGTKNA